MRTFGLEPQARCALIMVGVLTLSLFEARAEHDHGPSGTDYFVNVKYMVQADFRNIPP